jgi:hypothetical protein
MTRHRFHSICPYFAMFPEDFVRRHLVWAAPGEHVFDPFSGRGTTVFESLLGNRPAAGCDVNPVAVCVSNAKANPPDRAQALTRLREIRDQQTQHSPAPNQEFFRACFHESTLVQLLHLRDSLNWRRSRVDCFLAALALGALHGESHRSQRCFSNRMPRTISTKPEYSMRWWQKNGCDAPKRDVFRILEGEIDFRFASQPASLRGRVALGDARKAAAMFPKLHGRVGLVVTSPPYLDTTNYREDQWLRLWFLGGLPSPSGHGRRDDRHYALETYWDFLREAWAGMAPLLTDDARVIVRIGGKRLGFEEARDGLADTLSSGLGRRIDLVEQRTTKIRQGQLRAFRPGASGTGVEHDFHFALKARPRPRVLTGRRRLGGSSRPQTSADLHRARGT